ncbi:hypothetical protein ADIS_1116 [Lunatimonas lonarensis]|uniref:PH domain-containing protein n=1 Tax=Lunatimonas lonarensis TaxID=1232681 RepID=R7ZW62_9BACT|nr:hypothetical protein [Lunatimonas lonarensis]EON78253.1 hypothetical protein ADIS_1116 [Lunatimonas lonarensis]
MGEDFILKFEFERQNEWRILKKSILFHLIGVSGFLYYLLTKETVGLFIGFGFLIIIVPQILLHIQYRQADKNKTIKVNHSKRIIRIENKGEIRDIQFSDIEKIVRNKGQRDEDNLTYALPTFFYNYTVLLLRNKEKIYFTDFISKDLGLKGIDKSDKLSLLNFIL